ncbi:hypothetical protein BS50DRAFT_656542 [Corynespora cassiicola Philippines]|uniref:Uncharacterized protein n=1 Tax=Corynespora cassiicola Philippines TaxID=1448308 RepID=A0A2T2N3A0_CORCC|nr:hypothetical protein BS50DRAFT_656542 [Corynespora cassiicola Philippines]
MDLPANFTELLNKTGQEAVQDKLFFHILQAEELVKRLEYLQQYNAKSPNSFAYEAFIETGISLLRGMDTNTSNSYAYQEIERRPVNPQHYFSAKLETSASGNGQGNNVPKSHPATHSRYRFVSPICPQVNQEEMDELTSMMAHLELFPIRLQRDLELFDLPDFKVRTEPVTPEIPAAQGSPKSRSPPHKTSKPTLPSPQGGKKRKAPYEPADDDPVKRIRLDSYNSQPVHEFQNPINLSYLLAKAEDLEDPILVPLFPSEDAKWTEPYPTKSEPAELHVEAPPELTDYEEVVEKMSDDKFCGPAFDAASLFEKLDVNKGAVSDAAADAFLDKLGAEWMKKAAAT